MNVNVITPIRLGGPYRVGQNLADVLRRKGVDATWTHRLSRVLTSPLWQGADVVHSIDIPISYRLWRRPLVLTIQGDYTVDNTVWKRFYPRAIRMADVVTANSHFLKERLNLEDAVIIPGAVFSDRFVQVKHTDKDPINIVTVTKFYFKDKAKGVLNILEILDKVQKNTRRRIKYSVVGGGTYLEEIRGESGKYGVDVEFTGVVEDPGRILERSDIFVYYSPHDDFPNVFLEAMACGLPVVTNTVGSVAEIFEKEKDGYIAATDETYFEYVLNLLNRVELRDKIGGNARRTAETKFDWAKIGDQYIEIFRKLVGDNQDARG